MNRVIGITRPLRQSKELADLLIKYGWEPYSIPTIEISPSRNYRPIRKFVNELEKGRIDYVVFMSVNGVDTLFEISAKIGMRDQLIEGLKGTKLVSVGPKTAQRLSSLGIDNLLPEEFTSKGVVERLEREGIQGKTICMPRSRASDPSLRKMLEERGATVQEIYVYNIIPPKDDATAKKFLSDLSKKKIDAIIFSSSSTVKNLFKILEFFEQKKALIKMLNKCTVVAIGPVTKMTLDDSGIQVDVMPNRYTLEDAVLALRKHWHQ